MTCLRPSPEKNENEKENEKEKESKQKHNEIKNQHTMETPRSQVLHLASFLSWFSVPWITVCTYVLTRSLTSPPDTTHGLHPSSSSTSSSSLGGWGSASPWTMGWMYGVSAWMECCMEPWYVHLTLEGQVKERTWIESAALIGSCVIQYIGVMHLGQPYLAFGWARWGWSLILYLGMRGMVEGWGRKGSFRVLKSKETKRKVLESNQNQNINKGWGWKSSIFFNVFDWVSSKVRSKCNLDIDRNLLSVLWIFFKQSILKIILSEGDKFVLSIWFSNEEQGVYALVFNYGSILVRLLFFPLEEIARVVFPKLTTFQLQTHVLYLLLRLYFLMGLFLGLGYLALPDVLQFTFSQQWSSSRSTWSSVLLTSQWYAVYLPILGLHGILEAYVTMTVPSTFLTMQQRGYVGCSLFFFGMLTFAHWTSQTQAHVMVMANVFTVLLRTGLAMSICSWHHHPKRFHWSCCLPKWKTCLHGGMCTLVAWFTSSLYPHGWIGWTLLCGMGMLYFEWEYFQQLLQLRRGEWTHLTKKST
ncbi:Oligosaccharide translocation protein rft1 [Coelomomyces lativittatus]|nr:Oligosaccharide translocation protein rft1 [Coelomomyces lativittatus]